MPERQRNNLPQPAPPTQMFVEEAVVFHSFLMKFVHYPTNQGLWVETCSFGLYPVVRDFLTNEEFAKWNYYRRGIQQVLGERFVEDSEIKEQGFARPHAEETIRRVRRHFGIP